jgi:hypothetical protein
MTNQKYSNNKITENQIVKSGSLLSLFAFLLAVGIISRPIISSKEELSQDGTSVKAQSVAYQLMALELKKNQEIASNNLSQRSIASAEPVDRIGKIGADISGKPFQYKVRNEGTRVIVDVWAEDQGTPRTQVVFPDPVR